MRRRSRGVHSARRERGIALVFALALLSLLLVLGLAFVSNALINRQVARNNSARTQAKILAMAAVSRAAASIMLYQEQLLQTAPAQLLTENFSSICSYSDGGEAVVLGQETSAELRRKLLTDGLLGETSLLRLPEDDSTVSAAAAASFNSRFQSNALFPWSGTWVYFYDRIEGDDRRIIGRAAWQTVASSSQLLAPVFFRGGFSEVPGEAEHPAKRHRWGRDIFEADLSGTRLFKNVAAKYKGEHIADFEYCITKDMIAAQNDGDRRWLERWLTLDPNPELKSNAAWEPNATQLVPETYVYQPENSTEKRSLCRFNVSDLYSADPLKTEAKIKQLYGVSEKADPWYARFRIDSTTSADVNSETVLDELTRDSAPYANHRYDYELTTPESRSGLPFLRRIGADKGTFDNVAALRKQIAANFNDYCDGDSVPTSDVPAQSWSNPEKEPAFTGNEKTPYLYEFGVLAAFVQNPTTEGSVTTDTPGIACTLSPKTGTKPRTISLDLGLRLSPVVKLADIYGFQESGACRNLQAEMDFGEVSGSFKIRQITLKGIRIAYTANKRNYNVVLDDFTTDAAVGAQYPALTALDLEHCEFSFTAGSDDVVPGKALSFQTDFTAQNPYPLGCFSMGSPGIDGDPDAKIWHTVTAAGSKTMRNLRTGATALPELKLSANEVLQLARTQNKLPANYSNFRITAQPTAMTIDRIALTGFSFRPRRIVLTAERELTEGAAERFGIDYVKPFAQYPFAWSSAEGKELYFSSSSKNGILLGGIRNYDPRQNLNNADWYPYPEAGESALKAMPLLSVVQDCTAPKTEEISAVINVGQGNAPYSGTLSAFNPAAQNEENLIPGDLEAPECTAPGYSSSSALSTAVIRNAPMMSPWEIGMIHRGVRWQTINLKHSSSPAVPGSPVRPSDYAGNNGRWDDSGTSYSGGDAALLDQIKTCQLGATYGKINLNMLWSGNPEFDAQRDPDIFRALFEGIRYGEVPKNFLAASTRSADGFFAAESNGTGIVAVPEGEIPEAFDKLTDAAVTFPKTVKDQPSSQRYTNRAQIVDYFNGEAALDNAFGLIPEAKLKKDDAHLEEVIGKTVNLLTTDITSPDKICLAVIVQVILDCAGMRYLASSTAKTDFSTTNGETLKPTEQFYALPCQYGRFDAAIHQSDPQKNLYFDSIIGEVKLFVTLKRDPQTGRLSISKFNYVE